MATTKIWKVEKRLDHVIGYATNEEKTKNKFYKETQDDFYSVRQALLYATNPDKTEKKFYTTGINCEVENAIEQMIFTKKKYKKEKGILAFHAYQSFAKGEVTPEIAHEIGVKIVEEMWGDRFEVIVSTHLNTQCIHNHFVLNSVSFKDGYKYYSNLENTALFRKISDEICDEFGLKILDEKSCKSGINFENFYRKSLKNSDYYNFAKEDLDYAISHSYTLKEFHKLLRLMGYNYCYKAGKLSIKKESHKRNIRVERLFVEDYSEESIRQRILANDFVPEEKINFCKITKGKFYSTNSNFKKVYKPKGIIALYYYYKYLLKFYNRNISYKLTEEMRKNIDKMNHYSELIRFLCKYKLDTTENVYELKKKKILEKKYILNSRNRLYYKRGKTKSENEKKQITNQIIQVTEELKKVKKEIKMCDEVVNNSTKMKEQIKQVEGENPEKVQKRKMRNYEL